MSVPTPGFTEDYLAYLLAQASHLISHEFHEVVRRSGLPVMQWRVLATLVEGNPLSVGEVATIVLAPQSTLTRVAERMSRQGLLVRTTDEADRRITRLSITPKGQKVAQRLVAKARQHEETVLAPLGAESAAVLKDALRLLIRLHLHAPGSEAIPPAESADAAGTKPASRRKATARSASPGPPSPRP